MPGNTLPIHRGAIDQSTITTRPPLQVMASVRSVLEDMGVNIQIESEYKYRCVRLRRGAQGPATFDDDDESDDEDEDSRSCQKTPTQATSALPKENPHLHTYGDPSQDPGDEVRFSVELTRLDRLADTYSLDIRRLKGGLRGYKYVYDTLREHSGLQK